MTYSRILLKISGEVLAGKAGFGLDPATIANIASDIVKASHKVKEIIVVVGGGNFMRGVQLAAKGMDRPTADSMGMLGTVMNGLALERAIMEAGGNACTMSAISMPAVCETFSRQVASKHLDKGRIVICAGGTGNPFFSTDTTASLRAAELKCDVILKATNVDGIYSADPKKDPSATHFARLTHEECIAKDLKVMDTAAFALARENNIPILVFSLQNDKAIETVLKGGGKFTLVTGAKNG